ncbi:MAG: sugar phosphate isomerase/epimerase family protein [Gaiellaceae bacterium]
MSLSLSEISTVNASFLDDLAAYRAAGFDGIGIWETKLGDDVTDLEALRTSGLRATNCVPIVPSILPNAVIEGTWDVQARIGSICESLDRFARYDPTSVLCLTGARGGYTESKARRLVIEGLKRIADTANYCGISLGLEPIHISQREQLSLIATIPETLDLLDEAGLQEVGIMVDLWHLWDSPEIERHLTENVDRITGVHVADWYADGRNERALPGQGIARIDEFVGVLRDAGWNGAWDVEIFGDPENPKSFWGLDVDEAAQRAYRAIDAIVS